MVERLLLIVNRASGTGCSPAIAGALMRELRLAGVCPGEFEAAFVEDHRSARLAARSFMSAGRGQAAVIVAGGGGTLRAAVEGLCDGRPAPPSASEVLLGALRMGSGNVVARRMGVAFEPHEGMRQIAASLSSGRVEPCAVIRARFGTRDGGVDVRHAVTMCGLGQFGRTPGDLARWHRRLGSKRRPITALIGIERMNNLEYAVSAAARFAASTLKPSGCERVEVSLGERRERFRLLAGAVMNTRVGAIPIDPGVRIGDDAAGIVLLPRLGAPRRWRLARGARLEVRLLDREEVEFFLDEDPEVAFGEITVEIAGRLAFLPGARMKEGAA